MVYIIDKISQNRIESVFINSLREKNTSGDVVMGIQPIISVGWQGLDADMDSLLSSIEEFYVSRKPDTESIIPKFKNFIYKATELFDIYTNLFPALLEKNYKINKAKKKEFLADIKNMRSFCAELCNSCKHGGRQMFPVYATSLSSYVRSLRYIVVFNDGRGAWTRDERFHKKISDGRCMIKDIREIIHNLLKIDLRCGGLVMEIMSEGEKFNKGGVAHLFKTDHLNRVSVFQVIALNNEKSNFNDFLFDGNKVELKRSQARIASGWHEFQTIIRGDGISNTFSFR